MKTQRYGVPPAPLGRLAFVLMILMFAVPVFAVIIYSLNSADRGMVWRGLSLDWYARTWAIPEIQRALKNSLNVGSLAIPLSVLVGVGGAYTVTLSGRLFRPLIIAMLLVPLLAPDLLLALADSTLVEVLRLPRARWVIAVAQSGVGASYVAVLILIRLIVLKYWGLARAASTLGASQAQVFLRVFLPLAAPAIALGAALSGVVSLQDVLYAFFLGGAGTTTLPVHVYGLVRFGPHPGINVLYVAFLAVGLLVLTLEAKYADVARNLEHSTDTSSRQLWR